MELGRTGHGRLGLQHDREQRARASRPTPSSPSPAGSAPLAVSHTAIAFSRHARAAWSCGAARAACDQPCMGTGVCSRAHVDLGRACGGLAAGGVAGPRGLVPTCPAQAQLLCAHPTVSRLRGVGHARPRLARWHLNAVNLERGVARAHGCFSLTIVAVSRATFFFGQNRLELAAVVRDLNAAKGAAPDGRPQCSAPEAPPPLPSPPA